MPRYFNINYELNPAAVLDCIDRSVHAVSADVADGVSQYDFPQPQSTGGKAQYVCVADGNILQMVHWNSEYRKVVNGGLFSICDSSWVPLFLKWLYGMKVPQYCGSQIFEDAVRAKKYRMSFIGTSQEILESLRRNLSEKYDPRIAEMQFYELPFCKVEAFDYPTIANAINDANPDIIWVSLGAPKQEIFMSLLQPYLTRGVMIAVGAVFKFYGGVAERRAPRWMIVCRLEFVYRLILNPRKQFIRCWQIGTALPAILWAEWKRKKSVVR